MLNWIYIKGFQKQIKHDQIKISYLHVNALKLDKNRVIFSDSFDREKNRGKKDVNLQDTLNYVVCFLVVNSHKG